VAAAGHCHNMRCAASRGKSREMTNTWDIILEIASEVF